MSILRELGTAAGIGFPLGWALWWLSRSHSESAHIVDTLLELVFLFCGRWLGPLALGRLGGSTELALSCGVIAAALGLLLTPLTLLWERARGGPWKPCERSARRLGRHAGLQVALHASLWSAVELKSLAFDLFLSGDPGVLKLTLAAVTGALVFGFVTGAAVRSLARRLLGPLGESRRRACARLMAALPVAACVLLAISSRSPAAGWRAERVETLRATTPSTPTRVLVIGVDAASFGIVAPLIDAGRLPALADLFARGAGGRLRAVMPPFSPPVWTSIATGVRPLTHGIEGFSVPRPGSWESDLVGSTMRRVPALWDVASSAGIEVVVGGWFASFPATPVQGAMVSDRATSAGRPGRCFPDSLCLELDRILARLQADPAPAEWLFGPDSTATEEEREALDVLRAELLEDRLICAVSDSLLTRRDWRLGMVYVRTTDSVQHLFWKYRAARRHPRLAARLWPLEPAAVRRRAAAIDSVYAWTDRRVRRLIELAGPDAAVILVSDHGAGARLGAAPSYDLNPLLRAMGAQSIDAERGIDLARSIVYERSAEVPYWSPRRRLHLSIAGREQAGRLSAPAAAETRDGLIEELRAIERSDGRALFSRVAALDLDPRDPEAADIALRLARGLRPEMEIRLPGGGRIAARSIAPLSQASSFSGNHRVGGIIAAAGPGIRGPGVRLRGASALDLAPTVAVLLGLPIPDDMEGRVLAELLDPDWLEQHPPRALPSWGRRTMGERAVDERYNDDELRRRLRALGYIR